MRVGAYGGVEHGEADDAGEGVGFRVGGVFVDEGVLGDEVVVGLDRGFRRPVAWERWGVSMGCVCWEDGMVFGVGGVETYR